MAFGLLIAAIVLAIAGVVELVGALHLYLLNWVSPTVAALLIGLLLLLLAGGACLVARKLARPLPRSGRATRTTDDASAQAVAWIQSHPNQSAVLAAVLGFCMGAFPEARKAMSELAKTKR